MTIDFPILIEQMKIIGTLMLIGFCWQKLNLFDNHLIDSLSAIIAKLILPLMLCTVIGSVSFSELSSGIGLFAVSTVIYTISVTLSKALSRFYKIEEPKRSMHVLMQCYGNAGYIGIPLITSIYSQKAGIVAVAYTIVDSFFYWIIGPYLAGSEKISLKKFISPITVSIAAGILIILLKIDLSGNIIWETAKNVGNTCKYFASIYIGLTIGRMSIKKLKENIFSVSAAPVKLIVLPLFAYLAVGKTGILTGDSLAMFIILCSTPSGMSLPIVAEMSNPQSTEYVSVGVTLSTILCLFTLPFMAWLITAI